MANKKQDLQTHAILSAAYHLVAGFFHGKTINFDELRMDVLQGNSLTRLKAIVHDQLQSKNSSEYTLLRDYSIPNVEQASWNTLNVLFRLHDKLRLLKHPVGLEALHILIEDCIAEVEAPDWLQARIITHLPAIVLQEFSDHGLIEKANIAGKPYVVYCGRGLPSDCDAAGLLKYRKLGREGHFDIFIDDVPPQKLVLIKGEPGKFTPGKGLPYKILRYLLTRVGRDVPYSELRRSVWTLRQSQSKSGLSKILHDKLNEIRKQLRKASHVSEDEPDKWFQKSSVRGVIFVWEDLNSCLISMPASRRSSSE